MKRRTILFLMFATTATTAAAETKPAIDTRPALAAVNARRAKRGLRPLVVDPKLMALAADVSATRARRNHHGHLAGWQAGHARREGVGWTSRPDPSGQRFRSCCLYGRGWSRAGAALTVVPGRGTFYTLMVR